MKSQEERIRSLWEQFMDNNPTKEEIKEIFQSSKIAQPFRKKAAPVLLEMNPDHEECFLLMRIPELADRAWQKFLDSKPSNEDLLVPFKWNGLETFKKPAAEIILQQDPVNHELQKIVEEVPELRNKAGEMLINKYRGDKKDLYCLITKVDTDLKKTAAEMLLNHKKVDGSDLCLIAEYCHPKYEVAEYAAEKILEGKEEKSLAFLVEKYHCNFRFKVPASKKLLKIKASWSCLTTILLDEELHDLWFQSSKQILSQEDVGRSSLGLIVEKVPELREEAAGKMLKIFRDGQCDIEDIDFLIKFSEKFREDAENLKKTRVRKDLLYKMKIFDLEE